MAYGEEAAQPTGHNHKWHYNLLKKNTSNYVTYPIKYKLTTSAKIISLREKMIENFLFIYKSFFNIFYIE